MEKQSYELVTRTESRHDVIIIAYKGEGNKLKWFFNLKRRIKNTLREHPDIDIIHLNDGLMAAACTWLKKYTEIPVVATYHGLDLTFPSYLFQKVIIPKMHRLDGGICVSHATKEACLERGFQKEKVFTVLNGVDHDLAEIPKDTNFLEKIHNETGVDLRQKRIIVTMGRAVKRKGFSWFLKNVLPEITEGAVFVMIGPLNTNRGLLERVINLLPGSLSGKIQLMLGIATDVDAIVSALKDDALKGKVHHMGKVSFKDLMQYLAVADLFVMPNIKVPGDAEGFGLVALEASLRGAPVIAAGIEGITDAVRNDHNGILLPTADAQQWKSTINTLISDEERLAQMSQKAITTTLRDYGWEKMVDGYIEVFKKISQNS